MEKQQIGKITHFFGKIGVAVIEMKGTLKVGDRILVQGHGSEFEQEVESMEIDKQKIDTAKKGQSIGIKLDTPAKPGDAVYRL